MERRVPISGVRRKPCSVFLLTLIELRFSLDFLRGILELEEDHSFVALARVGLGRETHSTCREFARPFIAELDRFLRCHLYVFEHVEQDDVIRTIIHSIEPALAFLTDKTKPDENACIGARYQVRVLGSGDGGQRREHAPTHAYRKTLARSAQVHGIYPR